MVLAHVNLHWLSEPPAERLNKSCEWEFLGVMLNHEDV